MTNVSFFSSSFASRQSSGTASLALNLIRNLSSKSEFRDLKLELYHKNHHDQQSVRDLYKLNVEHTLLPHVRGRYLRSSRQFYKHIFSPSRHTDILHLTAPRFYPYVDKFPARNVICTFHAAGDITAPRDFFSASREIYNFIAKHQWKRLSGIVAVSKLAQYEIAENYGIPLSEIKVILPGADGLWGTEAIKPNFGNFLQERPYILIIGRFQKFKNIHTVLETIQKNHHEFFPDVNIVVLARGSGPIAEHCISLLNSMSEKAKHLDFVEAEEYLFLLRNASLVIHPSVNEGFGIPAFEAFGEGASLLVHQSTPSSSMLGNFSGVVSVDMLDPDQVLNAIIKNLSFVTHDIAARRNYLVGLGATWELMARNYADFYRSF